MTLSMTDLFVTHTQHAGLNALSDVQHNDNQHYDTQHNDTQHKGFIIDTPV